MPRRHIIKIREKIRLGQYDMTSHAMEEMAEDKLDILDIEESVKTGEVVREEKDDPRGTKYVVKGMAADGLTPVGTVGRFATNGRYLFITAYEVTDPNE